MNKRRRNYAVRYTSDIIVDVKQIGRQKRTLTRSNDALCENGLVTFSKTIRKCFYDD